MGIFMIALEFLKAVRSIAELVKLSLEIWRERQRQRTEVTEKDRD